METKFKKGDRVRAVKSDSFGSFQKGDEGEVMCVDYKNVAIDFKRGTSISMSLRGVEDVFELIDRPDSPRLASDMTMREHYAGLALNAFLSNAEFLRKFQADNRDQNNTNIANTCVLFADSLIQALNENP